MKSPGWTARVALWVGFLAAVVPLMVLVALQTRWLEDLDQASLIARENLLGSFAWELARELEAEIERRTGEALAIPVETFAAGSKDQFAPAAEYFSAHAAPAAARRFLVDYILEGPYRGMTPVFYDADRDLLFSQYQGPEELFEALPEISYRGAFMAASMWNILAYSQEVIETVPGLQADRRMVRLLYRPVIDDQKHVVGIAGMELDEAYARKTLIPEALREALVEQFGDEADRYTVVVKDTEGRRIYAEGPALDGEDGYKATFSRVQPLPLAFDDWRLSLAGPLPATERYAQVNAQLNFALLVLLVLALLGGVLLAFRTATHAMRLSQMKSDFVSNVSHELRTPLASVRVFGELLRLGKVSDPAKVREYGEYIETESRRLTQLINNILDFSRIESGVKEYRFRSEDLSEVVAETLELFSVRLQQHGFRVTFERPPEPVPVRLDPAALAQSVSNLLDNAVKYSGDSREIAVRVERDEGEAVVSVQDWGMGIPRADQAKIFDRFHRVGTGLVHDVKGSGLGLAIVRHIAQAHGGRITVTSRSGQGSTFSLHLPLERGDAIPRRDPSNIAMEI